MDWNAAGAAVGGVIVGAGGVLGPWLRSRKKHKALQEPWDGVTDRRHKRERLTGGKILNLLEEDESPMPRHWQTYIDTRMAHKINNAMNPVNVQLGRVEAEVAEMKEGVSRLEGVINRLIGRLLPNEPVGG